MYSSVMKILSLSTLLGLFYKFQNNLKKYIHLYFLIISYIVSLNLNVICVSLTLAYLKDWRKAIRHDDCPCSRYFLHLQIVFCFVVQLLMLILKNYLVIKVKTCYSLLFFDKVTISYNYGHMVFLGVYSHCTIQLKLYSMTYLNICVSSHNRIPYSFVVIKNINSISWYISQVLPSVLSGIYHSFYFQRSGLMIKF